MTFADINYVSNLAQPCEMVKKALYFLKEKLKP